MLNKSKPEDFVGNKPRPEDFVGYKLKKANMSDETLSELQQARVVIGASFIGRTDECITVNGEVRSDLREIVDNILVELLK